MFLAVGHSTGLQAPPANFCRIHRPVNIKIFNIDQQHEPVVSLPYIYIIILGKNLSRQSRYIGPDVSMENDGTYGWLVLRMYRVKEIGIYSFLSIFPENNLGSRPHMHGRRFPMISIKNPPPDMLPRLQFRISEWDAPDIWPLFFDKVYAREFHSCMILTSWRPNRSSANDPGQAPGEVSVMPCGASCRTCGRSILPSSLPGRLEGIGNASSVFIEHRRNFASLSSLPSQH
jgi:hypothetical protein